MKGLVGAVSSVRQELSDRWVYNFVYSLQSPVRRTRSPVQEQRVEALLFENPDRTPPVLWPSGEAVNEDHRNRLGQR